MPDPDHTEYLYDPTARAFVWRDLDRDREEHPRAPTPHTHEVRRRCHRCGGWRDAAGQCIGAAETRAIVEQIALQKRAEEAARPRVNRIVLPGATTHLIVVRYDGRDYRYRMPARTREGALPWVRAMWEARGYRVAPATGDGVDLVAWRPESADEQRPGGREERP